MVCQGQFDQLLVTKSFGLRFFGQVCGAALWCRRIERWRKTRLTLVEPVRDYGVLDQQFERDDLEGGLVGGFEDDGAGGSGLLDLEPAGGTDAPAVARFQAVEAELWHGGGEVVAESF